MSTAASTTASKRRPSLTSLDSAEPPAKRPKNNKGHTSPQSALQSDSEFDSARSPTTTTTTTTTTSVKNIAMSTVSARKKGRGGKKLVIKPFKVKPSLPANFEDDTWAVLKAAVNAIHSSQPVSTSLEELYKMCENLCSHKMSANLYTRLERECEVHLQGQVERVLGKTNDPTEFLQIVNAVWCDHVSQMGLICQIFLVLDRTYVMQTTGMRSLWNMGLTHFRTHVLSHVEVLGKVMSGLMELIKTERRGDVIDRGVLSSLVRMLDQLDLYKNTFEDRFLEATRGFYEHEGAANLGELNVPNYLLYVEERLAQESDRVSQYLDNSTHKPLTAVLEDTLLAAHVNTLINKGFDELMDTDRQEDLARMYALIARVNGSAAVKTALSNYIKKRGCAIVQNEDTDSQMVQMLLDFKRKIDTLLAAAFRSKESYRHTIKDSFEHFINTRQNKPAELIAKFVDAKLRSSGHKGASEEELEAVLDDVMVLFRYIHGKDVFEAFYKKDLAKRLLLQKSASFDAEKSMIVKLKTECGCAFTSKLEGMFKDIDISRDIMSSFKQTGRASDKIASSLDIYVNVLTMGFWPTYPPAEVNLPPNLATAAAVFRDFYLSKHNGRRLIFQNSLGHCILAAQFSKRKELSVSLFQAVVLLQFNDNDKLTLEELVQLTGIEDKELRRTLQSLACGKINTRVIVKRPKGRDVNDGDSFYYNKEFANPKFRVKINQIQMKETVEENQATNERVFQDRQYQIDAAIVRIMKTRKQLTHQLLVAECFNQLKFPIRSSDLKKRIESLIDREYLERDKSSTSLYNYLA